MLEESVDGVFREHRLPCIQSAADDPMETEPRIGLTVKPVPEFFVLDREMTLRGIPGCQGANDGGTALDKAARLAALRVEANGLEGVPLFGVLVSFDWR